MKSESRKHGGSPARVVPRGVLWGVIGVFILVNAAILIRARVTRTPVRQEAPAPQVKYGETVSWSGTDALGRTAVIPNPARAVVVTEVDPAQGQETLARIRTLTTGRCEASTVRPVVVFATAGTDWDRRGLAGVVASRGHVVDCGQLTEILGDTPWRYSPWSLVVVDPGGTIALSLPTTKTSDLQVLLAQWYNWRWHS